MLNFEYQYGFKEFAMAYFFLMCQSKAIRLLFAITMAFNLGALAIHAIVYHHIKFDDIVDFFLILILFSVMFAISPSLQFRRFKDKILTLQIENDSLKSKMQTIASEIGWDNILKVVKLGDMLGFFYTKNCAILLPLRLVNDSEKQVIRQLCQQKNIPTKF